MASMSDLVQWYGAQLDEDERIARAVRVPHDWHQGPGDDPEWTDAELVCMWPPEFHTPYERDKHWRGLTVEGAELAAFIAAHDPARVLRDVQSDRILLAAYASAQESLDAIAHPDMYDVGRGQGLEDAVRYRAVRFAHREGYREEWRP